MIDGDARNAVGLASRQSIMQRDKIALTFHRYGESK
jgi:hypothetical protein